MIARRLFAVGLLACASLFAQPQAFNPLTYDFRTASASAAISTRTIRVDAGLTANGTTIFSTVEAATAYVATQTRSDAARWVINLEPGPDYSVDVAPLVVPSYTSIQGNIPQSILPFSGQARIISPAVSSGTFIQLNTASALVNVSVRFSGTLSAAARVVEIAGSGAAMINCTIENNASAATQALTLVETVSGTTTSFYAYYSYWASIVSATNLTYFKHQNAGTVYLSDILARSSTGAAAIVHNTSTGTISVIRSALGPFYSTNSDPNTCSLKNDSTGKIEPVQTSFWGPLCGTIDDWHAITRIRTFVDTPFATCSPTPSEIALDIGTTKRLCACVAANTWNCTTLSP